MNIHSVFRHNRKVPEMRYDTISRVGCRLYRELYEMEAGQSENNIKLGHATLLNVGITENLAGSPGSP